MGVVLSSSRGGAAHGFWNGGGETKVEPLPSGLHLLSWEHGVGRRVSLISMLCKKGLFCFQRAPYGLALPDTGDNPGRLEREGEWERQYDWIYFFFLNQR